MDQQTPRYRPADSAIPYDWFTWVPDKLPEPVIIWITGLHGNIASEDYADITVESRNLIERVPPLTSYAERYGVVMLVPVIPRVDIPEPYLGYAILLLRHVFGGLAPEICQRPDLQVMTMIDHLQAELRAMGHLVEDRVVIDGFSAGGMFAQRFTLLHPERVLAASIGHAGGALTLPEERLGHAVLPWPLGVADFEELAGCPFNRSRYREVQQLVYIGDQDTDHSTVWLPGELWPAQADIDYLNHTFGKSDPVRLGNQVRLLRDLDYSNIQFRLYPDIGHDGRALRDDAVSFLANAVELHQGHR